ncbi:transforming growth factor-beta receptor-associated protein 1 homolog [Cyclopterus lumpus]|uniref:transforming growth factor-beta receptor-associated protein 1 homolog n=1 Tax=Cyclopterus lumpus TaxID=8103 RepID=UPI00148659A7|nr:transforming growth factor-beta receptor-associated protein 1 homolog [Cyclopterus lumpus]XP_034381602.1 transforming growth factor-beta receptor-associated protein 1 homolog [Cyclopterus lumpus]XP_034381603.1 transforming growth factor-beta receptor-associated protein 1 homolog [Cyclopterus lumpus]XP_034381604.1 transforming growth factor-beta receptor-associated protein 1 homolog [Cyclopterus lumpus]
MSVKAFELVPAVERDLLMGDKARINIECIECCGKHLYMGTNDCFIHHFLLDEVTSSKGKLSYSAQKLLHKYMGLKKPVAELRAASALERLIVLCDGIVFLVDMVTLETVPSAAGGGAKIRGVTSFCINENPVNGDPFCVEMGVLSSKRRTVQIYMVYEDRVQLVKEVTTPEQPCAVSVDGYFLCLALTSQYMILNYNTGASQDLFPYNSEERRPIVKRIGREEFLLAAHGGLGMFANAEGVSQRAPVNWSESVIGAAVCFPYVVALDESFITIHSMLDQQLKQTLSFRDGHILQDFEGKVILASTKAVYVLVPLPLERQIQDLLANHKVEEALILTEGAQQNIPKEKFQILHKRILQQAGFIQFGQLQFLEAKEHFRKGQLDVRELISLYPLLLPASSSFTRCHPPLHEFADLNHLAQGDEEKVLRCKKFLITYLGEVRSTEVANGCREDVDTALLKLYAEQNHDSLLDLLASDNACLVADSIPWLEKYHKYFALGLLYHYNGQDSAALQLWIQVADGDLQDSTRADLYEYIVDFLCSSSNLDLVWKYADWALRKDPTMGVNIFRKRPASKELLELNPDDVVSYLGKHSQALLLYLEHLVLERWIKKEKFHTHLAVLYLERVLTLLSQSPTDEEQISRARERLQTLFRVSNLYRAQFLLGKMENCEQLLLERATLHGKLEEHDKALHILVHKLRDFPAAEAFCVWASSCRDSVYREQLFHLLLGVYLDGNPPGKPQTAAGGGDLEMAAVDLLNRHGEVFDAVRVLHMLPEGWSLQLLRPFLGRAIRASMHACRTSQIAMGLAHSENRQLLHDRLKDRKKPIFVSEKKGCHLCHNTFSEPDVVCLPGGVPVHTHCVAQRVRDSPTKRQLTNSSSHT